MSRRTRFGGVLLAVTTLSCGLGTPGRVEPANSEALSQTDCPASHVRNTDRALLCARVIDRRTGVGVPGGDVEFVRKDGESMAGTIEPDGTFSINVPGGRGMLTINWSCRRSVRLVNALTVPAGQGMERTFRVAITPADTLCRRESQDLSDTSHAAVARWVSRGPCFALALGQWKPTISAEHMPPPWVRLDSAPQPSSKPGSVQPLHYERSGRASWRSAGWRPLQGDSIELLWSKDFDGVSLTLGVQGDSLAGRGIWTSDMIFTDSLGFLDRTIYPDGAASARRVPCR
jgi:hypothetical protein